MSITTLSDRELRQFWSLVRESIGIRRHIDLLRWLQGDLQRFLAHDIMIAAWGDFELGMIHYDIVSPLPGVRTERADTDTLSPLLHGLFDRWIELGKVPYTLGTDEAGFLLNDSALGKALQGMRSSLVHGISDERDRHDCLYIAFSASPSIDNIGRSAIEFLLPYLDTALRQVPHLPLQHHASAPANPVETSEAKEAPEMAKACADYGLSEREAEIMRWVSIGKTNAEIGSILDISAFTVKNHLQRIFKKLDVFNRMQAVTKFAKSTNHAHVAPTVLGSEVSESPISSPPTPSPNEAARVPEALADGRSEHAHDEADTASLPIWRPLQRERQATDKQQPSTMTENPAIDSPVAQADLTDLGRRSRRASSGPCISVMRCSLA